MKSSLCRGYIYESNLTSDVCHDVVRASRYHYVMANQNGGDLQRVPANHSEFTSITDGTQNGSLIFIGGDIKVARALVYDIIGYSVRKVPQSVVIFSPGIPAEQLWHELFCSDVGLVLNTCRLIINDSSDVGPSEILAEAKLIKAEHGLSLIVINCVRMVREFDAIYGAACYATSTIVKALNATAKELNVPVIVISG